MIYRCIRKNKQNRLIKNQLKINIMNFCIIKIPTTSKDKELHITVPPFRISHSNGLVSGDGDQTARGGMPAIQEEALGEGDIPRELGEEAAAPEQELEGLKEEEVIEPAEGEQQSMI